MAVWFDYGSPDGHPEPRQTDLDAQCYFGFHRKRYQYLFDTIAPILKPGTRVLDIGVSAFPRLLLQKNPEIVISTLGFKDARYWTPEEWTHYECDLNDPEFSWASIGSYDVVILAGVIEHLYSPPQGILKLMRSLLNLGGWLLVQPPNAASLEKPVQAPLWAQSV